MALTNHKNIPELDSFDNSLKYKSLVLLFGHAIRHFAILAKLVVSLVRYLNKGTNSSSSNLLVSEARPLTMLRILVRSDMLNDFCVKKSFTSGSKKGFLLQKYDIY